MEGREDVREGREGCRDAPMHFLERGRALEEGREEASIRTEGAFFVTSSLCTNLRCSSNLISEDTLLSHR